MQHMSTKKVPCSKLNLRKSFIKWPQALIEQPFVHSVRMVVNNNNNIDIGLALL